MKSLTGLDAAFLSFETQNAPLQVGAVMTFEPPGKQLLFSDAARFGFVKRMVADRLHLAPPLRRRAVNVPFGLGHPVWIEDPELDLDAHVKRARLPTPGGAAELNELVADLFSRPLDRTRPLWEMVVTEGLEENSSALVVKLHHSILDGVSGASLMASFLDLGPRPRDVEPPGEQWQPEPLPSAATLVRGAVTEILHDPGVAAGAVHRSIRIAAQLTEQRRRLAADGTDVRPQSPFNVPKTSLNGSISTRRGFATASLSLSAVKMCGRGFGATVNDVVLSVVGGSLRSLLEQRGEDLEESLVAMVPVSTRDNSRRPSRAGAGEGEDADDPAALGNRVSAMLVSLATTIEDPVRRLGAVSASSRLAKERTDALGPQIIDDITQLIPPALLTRTSRLITNLRLFDRMAPVFNVTVSNVPGPQFDLWFGGSRVSGIYPIGPIVDGAGLNVTALSYNNRLYVGMLGCRKLAPDIEILPRLMELHLDELIRALPESAVAAAEAG